MTLPSLFEGVPGTRRALVADPSGRVLEASGDEAWAPEQDAAATAMMVGYLATAGSASLTAVRPDAYLRVEVDPNRRTAEAEKVLARWADPDAAPSADSGSLPLPAATNPSLPSVPVSSAGAAEAGAPGHEDAWTLLRRALVRAHLTDASRLQEAIAEAPPPAQPRPGAEPLAPEALRGAMQRMVEGIGNVLAGDTVGGARSLRELASPAHPNLSFRWLALYWSARAAMGGSGLEAARLLVKDALELSRQLDVEARGVSQLIAAELLARAGEGDKSLTWLREARSRFDRTADQWGLGRTWLVEARVWAASGNDGESLAAANRAKETDPAWDGPPIFLAERALALGDLDGTERTLSGIRTPMADRLRRVVEVVRQGLLTQADATEYLRVNVGPPTTQALRALERIANAAPRFLQAREALAWMLLKMGKYPASRETFTWLLSQPLGPADRALVMLGLSCIASATRAAEKASEPPAGPAPAPNGEPRPPPRLSESALAPRGAQPGFSGLDAVFSGRLSVFSLPDLVEFLRSARRTGVLVCSSPSGMGSMRFNDGWICGASAPATPSVAELLFRTGKLTPEALGRVTADQEEPPPDDLIGERLVQLGLVDAATVEQTLRLQIEQTLREMVKWTDGEFAFSREAGEQGGGRPPAVRVDAQELLLSFFKEMDEFSRGLASSDVEA